MAVGQAPGQRTEIFVRSSQTLMRICIDARLESGMVGGVEQVVLGAAAGFSALEGDDEYIFLTLDDGTWLKPFVGGNCRIEPISHTPTQISWKGKLKARLPGLKNLWHTFSPLLGRRSVTLMDGTDYLKIIQPDLVHFIIQTGFLTAVPSIFSPFDLQHIHLPENFTPRERFARDYLYKTFCDQATIVVAASHWGKNDLVSRQRKSWSFRLATSLNIIHNRLKANCTRHETNLRCRSASFTFPRKPIPARIIFCC
jgi:hypothetical protein